MGGREGARLGAPGSSSAWSRRREHAELRCLKTAPPLGPAPRRSPLREHCCFACSEIAIYGYSFLPSQIACHAGALAKARRLPRAEIIMAAEAKKEIELEI